MNFQNIAPFIDTQGESLRDAGVDVRYFPIDGKGVRGYLNAASNLRRYLENNSADIIHAHYTLSGWSAVLARPKQPIVLSLMGTDAYGAYVGVNKVRFFSRYLIFLTYLIQPFVKSIICKSKHIESFVYVKNRSYVIPNGILFDKIAYHADGYRSELGLDLDRKYVLFLGDKNERRKNFELAEKAVELMQSIDISLLAPYPISHEAVVKYLNSVNLAVVPSLMEGSPNVVKEAMACNCPVVATNVGDIAWLFGNEPGYFLTSFDPQDVALNIRKALDFSQNQARTQGRARLIELGLDSHTIAKRLIAVYKSVLQKHAAQSKNQRYCRC